MVDLFVVGHMKCVGVSLPWQVVISRGELMKQAEKLLDELGWSKAVLEIQYEHEVCYNMIFTLQCSTKRYIICLRCQAR